MPNFIAKKVRPFFAYALCIVGMIACTSIETTPQPVNNINNPPSMIGEDVVLGKTYTIESSVYATKRCISVRLPLGYAETPDKKYPVMYVIDGGPEQDFPHLAGILQSVDLNYTLEPIILIGIETENRRYEITPPTSDSRYDEQFQERGGADEFRQYIRDDVFPWVSKHFRVKNDKAVIGESLGGLFIVDTFLNDPTLFKRYAAISPSLWWDDLSLVKKAHNLLSDYSNHATEIYLSMGNEGWNMQAGLDILIEAIKSNGSDKISWSYIDRRNSEEHGSIYHPAALDAMRTFYSTPYRTGASSKSFYLFPEGEAPPLSERAQKSLEKECNKENATRTTFEETNTSPAEWNGVCVLMKPGAKVDMGNY